MYIQKIGYVSANYRAKDELLNIDNQEYFICSEKFVSSDVEIWCEDITKIGLEKLKELLLITEYEFDEIVENSIDTLVFY